MAALPAVNRDWLASLHASAVQQPLRPRVPLWAGESVIGSVEPGFIHQIALQPTFHGHHQLLKEEHPAQLGWRLMGDVTISLNQLAKILHLGGLAGAWRDEQLAVHDQFGHLKGTVERAAVRPLGIATLAVHLVAQAPDGSHWVQQRALNKSNDPGLWDTTMGGMVSASDTVDSALARETWEEAGLRMQDLQGLTYGGRVSTKRPSADGGGASYIVEDIEWYRCTLPQGITPVNQDGEVAQFKCMGAGELLDAMQQGSFTLEAALVLAAAMQAGQVPGPV